MHLNNLFSMNISTMVATTTPHTSAPIESFTQYQTAAVFKSRIATLRDEEFWKSLSRDFSKEDQHIKHMKQDYMKISKRNHESHKYLSFATQMVLTTGGVQADSVSEAKHNTAEVLAERKQLADQFKHECVNYKNQKLSPSVLSFFPLINAQTGRAIRPASSGSTSKRVNMSLASWRY